MMLLRTLTAICCFVASAGAWAAPALDRFISFADPYRCISNKDFERLLSSAMRWQRPDEPFTPPIPASFRPHFGPAKLTIEGNEYRVVFPLNGTWRGLPLRSLVVVSWAESEGGFYLVFDASLEEVRQAANSAGFRIPASGNEYKDEGVLGVNVGIETYAGGTALYCIAG